MSEFGDRLRMARLGALERTGKEMSQSRLAVELDLASQTVSAWEAGRATPGTDIIKQIAELLGVTASWLAFGEGPRYPTEPATPTTMRVQSTGSTQVEGPTPAEKKRTG